MVRVPLIAVIAVGVVTQPSFERLAWGDQADFLVKPAEQAWKERKLGLAVSLYRGILAIRGDGDEAAWRLADVWTLAGEFEAAADELTHYKSAVADPDKQAAADKQIADLARRPHGFSGAMLEITPATAEAREAFRRGRQLFDAKKYADAILLYRAGVEMAPDLAGNYRELAEAYQKVGRGDEATQFFVRYLRLRPFGKNADEVRARLGGAKSPVLGRLSVESSFPCEQIWMNRQPVKGALPLTLVVAPGRYRLLCYSERYHFARYLAVDVTKGEAAEASFQWSIVENKLDPWGRIVMENPDRPTEMNDIGVWDEIGVPVPEDRRSLRVQMKAADGSKHWETLLKLEPGKRIPLVW